MHAPLPVFLLGPTAIGKSDLAADLAHACGGEIVSADAYQIYRGLDLLTAKPDAATLARAPHHLIGEIPLTEPFDVAKYAALADTRIADIQARGRLPIIVGGTGLYVRALTHGLADLPAADATLRAELNSLPPAELVRRLTALDPIGAAQIDSRNPRRVIRALEICLLTGQPFSRFREQWEKPRFPLRGVHLTRERADLYARIDARTDAMFAAGVIDEVRAVTAISDTASQALGYRDIRRLIAGEITHPECVQHLRQATRHYAKRQHTWFRRDTAFHLLPIAAGQNPTDLTATARALLTSPSPPTTPAPAPARSAPRR